MRFTVAGGSRQFTGEPIGGESNMLGPGVAPLQLEKETDWITVAVTGAEGGSGDLFDNSTDTASVLLRNIGAFSIEYRVDNGEWIPIEVHKSASLDDVNLADNAVRLRKGRFAADGLARFEIVYLKTKQRAEDALAGIGGKGNLSDVTYNGDDKVSSYTLDGVDYTVSYPDSATIIHSGAGITRTITLDGSSRVTGISVVEA